MMAITVHNLTFCYQEKQVLRDISLEAPTGSFTAVLGRNGSGKSTLVKIMAGLLPYKKGRVTVFGKDLDHLSPVQRARLIGYLPQFHSPVFPFTVEEVVLTGRASYVFALPGARDREKATGALERVGIGELSYRPYTELSGGERQMVMIARVLAQEPRAILLDEPLSHLDLPNQTRLLRLLNDLAAEGYIVIAVFHDPNTAFCCADQFIFLKNGAIREVTAGQAPWDSAILSDIYDTRIETIPFRGRSFVIPL